MAALILSVISVIGWILLGLLLLILAILLLVLFFPVTYQVKGRKSDTEMMLRVKVNWLFGLARLRYSYPEPGKLVCKVLFWNLLSAKKEKGTKKEQAESEDSTETNISDAQNQKRKAAEISQTGNSQLSQDADPSGSGESDATGGNASATDTASEDAEAAKTEEQSAQKKSLKEKISAIVDKIKSIKDNVSYYTQLLQESTTKRILQRILDKVAAVLKHIRPRKLEADLLIGTGSPDTTGYLMGAYGVFLPVLGRKINITPDFTQAVIQGRIDIRGHITVLVLLINACKLIFDKELRILIKKLKNGGKKNG